MVPGWWIASIRGLRRLRRSPPRPAAPAKLYSVKAGSWEGRRTLLTLDLFTLSDNAFDRVMANYMIHYAPDLDRCFAEVARVLRPAGSGVVSWHATARSVS